MPSGLQVAKWEDSAGLEHHCDICQKPLAHPSAMKTCIGKHSVPCWRFHGSFHRYNVPQRCKPCFDANERHELRHRNIAQALKKLKDKDEGPDSPARDPLTPTRVFNILSGLSGSNSYNDSDNENGEVQPLRKRDKKELKRNLKMQIRAKVPTTQEIEVLWEVLHPDHNKNAPLIKDAGEAFRLQLASLKRADINEESKTPDVSDEVQRILRAFDIPSDDAAVGKSQRAAVQQLSAMISDDLLQFHIEEVGIVQRGKEYLNWASRGAYDHMLNNYENKDWRTGAKVDRVESLIPEVESDSDSGDEVLYQCHNLFEGVRDDRHLTMQPGRGLVWRDLSDPELPATPAISSSSSEACDDEAQRDSQPETVAVTSTNYIKLKSQDGDEATGGTSRRAGTEDFDDDPTHAAQADILESRDPQDSSTSQTETSHRINSKTSAVKKELRKTHDLLLRSNDLIRESEECLQDPSLKWQQQIDSVEAEQKGWDTTGSTLLTTVANNTFSLLKKYPDLFLKYQKAKEAAKDATKAEEAMLETLCEDAALGLTGDSKLESLPTQRPSDNGQSDDSGPHNVPTAKPVADIKGDTSKMEHTEEASGDWTWRRKTGMSSQDFKEVSEFGKLKKLKGEDYTNCQCCKENQEPESQWVYLVCPYGRLVWGPMPKKHAKLLMQGKAQAQKGSPNVGLEGYTTLETTVSKAKLSSKGTMSSCSTLIRSEYLSIMTQHDFSESVMFMCSSVRGPFTLAEGKRLLHWVPQLYPAKKGSEKPVRVGFLLKTAIYEWVATPEDAEVPACLEDIWLLFKSRHEEIAPTEPSCKNTCFPSLMANLLADLYIGIKGGLPDPPEEAMPWLKFMTANVDLAVYGLPCRDGCLCCGSRVCSICMKHESLDKKLYECEMKGCPNKSWHEDCMPGMVALTKASSEKITFDDGTPKAKARVFCPPCFETLQTLAARC